MLTWGSRMSSSGRIVHVWKLSYTPNWLTLKWAVFLCLDSEHFSPQQSFVIIERCPILQPSLMADVDYCFKSHYVLDINYQPQCEGAWEFFEGFFNLSTPTQLVRQWVRELPPCSFECDKKFAPHLQKNYVRRMFWAEDHIGGTIVALQVEMSNIQS